MKTLDLKTLLALERFEAAVRTFSDVELLGLLVGYRFAIDALEAIDAMTLPDPAVTRVVRLLGQLMGSEATIQNECERRMLPIGS